MEWVSSLIPLFVVLRAKNLKLIEDVAIHRKGLPTAQLVQDNMNSNHVANKSLLLCIHTELKKLQLQD
jgi:hypothetical protein